MESQDVKNNQKLVANASDVLTMIINLDAISWPPPYKIKKHKQARHVKLRPSKIHGLEITVPHRFNLRDLPPILDTHRMWIEKQLAKLQLAQKDELPLELSLRAFHENWRVFYLNCHETKLERVQLNIIERPQNEIVVIGNIHDKNLCRRHLIAWLKNKAKAYLNQQLHALSKTTQLTFTRLTVRDQKTLWGSCTVTKALSLNYKLIFLPAHLVAHVIIHELCHTQHLNHSARFWRLVARHDLNWQAHKKALRYADQYVPNWL